MDFKNLSLLDGFFLQPKVMPDMNMGFHAKTIAVGLRLFRHSLNNGIVTRISLVCHLPYLRIHLIQSGVEAVYVLNLAIDIHPVGLILTPEDFQLLFGHFGDSSPHYLECFLFRNGVTGLNVIHVVQFKLETASEGIRCPLRCQQRIYQLSGLVEIAAPFFLVYRLRKFHRQIL